MFGETAERQEVTKIYFNKRHFENNIWDFSFLYKRMIHRFTISKPEPLLILKQYSLRMAKGNWWKILKDQKVLIPSLRLQL